MDRRRFLAAAAAVFSAQQAVGQGAGAVRRLRGRTIEGVPYALEQDAGKVVLVFFWSMDCAVCRDKLPELRRNYTGWKGKNFQIVGVNVDRSIADLRRYVELLDRVVPPDARFPMLWRGDAGHQDDFGAVNRTPTSFVLDRHGRVARTFAGRIEPALWDDIAELVLL